MPSLEDRVRHLEDRAALQDLIVAYFLATDDDDLEKLRECFTPDAEFVATGFSGTSGGRDAIVEFLAAARTAMTQTVHTPNFIQLKFEGDHKATGVVGAHLELGMGGSTLYGAVRYLDSYEKCAGCWKIRKREMRVIHVGPWQEVSSSLSVTENVRWPGAAPQPSDFQRPHA